VAGAAKLRAGSGLKVKIFKIHYSEIRNMMVTYDVFCRTVRDTLAKPSETICSLRLHIVAEPRRAAVAK
jgi:hypothetical protein